MTFSVVIPTLNEAESLSGTLSAALRAQAAGNAGGHAAGIVVSDGASTDATCALARAAGVQVFSGPAGRGRQMAAGIQATEGDVVVLVHADTWLPETAFAAMARGQRVAKGLSATASRGFDVDQLTAPHLPPLRRQSPNGGPRRWRDGSPLSRG